MDLGKRTNFILQLAQLVGEPAFPGMDPSNLKEFFSGTNWIPSTQVESYGPLRFAKVELGG